MSRILVIGATGKIGREVVAQLAQAGTAVRGLSRHPASISLPNVELVQADLSVPETLDPALDGVETVFLVWTAPPAAFTPALDRIARKSRRIVYLSAPLRTPHPFFQQPNPSRQLSENIERLIEASGMEWTVLRPHIFAANALAWWGPKIRAGEPVRWPYLHTETAPIDERDIAAVAVRALTEPGHTGAEYVITGPQSVTQFEQLSIIGDALGRRLEVEEISADEARQLPIWRGAPAVINMLLDAWSAALGRPAYVTKTVEKLTGRPARAFAEWARRHAAAFGGTIKE